MTGSKGRMPNGGPRTFSDVSDEPRQLVASLVAEVVGHATRFTC